MADQTPAQMGLPGFAQTGQGTPPAAAATNPELSNILSSLNSTTASLADTMEAMSQQVGKLKMPLTDVGRELDHWQLQLKASLGMMSDYEDSFKRLTRLSKQFSESGVYKARTYRELKGNLEDLLSTHKELMEKGIFNVKDQRQIERGIDEISHAVTDLESGMKKAGKTADQAFDPEVFAKVVNHLQAATTATDKLGDRFRRLYLGDMTRQLSDMSRILGRSKIFEKYDQAAQKAGMFKEYRNNLESEGRKKISQRGAHLPPDLANMLKLPLDARGNIDMAAFKKIRNARQAEQRPLFGKDRDYGAMARKLSNPDQDDRGPLFKRRSLGVSRLVDQWVGKRVMQDIDEGGTPGTGAKAMMLGGGSFTKGLGQMALHSASSMGEGVQGALAAAGPYGMAIEAIMDLIDRNSAQNRKVTEATGTGGLFNQPGQTAQEAMLGARKALVPGLFDMGYQSFERNLAIAHAVNKSGVNLPQLAYGSESANQGSMGAIKGVAYGGAKMAGFIEEGQATEQIMKLLQRYHTSLQGSKDFFTDINRDTARAGITTTKYIQILDDVNSQFDRFGQSLQETVNLMRVLGRTGISSSEDVKEALDSMANAGQKRSTEVQAFIYAQAGRSGRLGELAQGQQQIYKATRGRAEEQLGGLGVNISGMQINNEHDVAKVRAMLAKRSGELRGTPAEDPVAIQAANSTLNQMAMEMRRAKAYGTAASQARQGRVGEAGVGLATQNAFLGNNLFGQTFQNLEGIRTTYATHGMHMGQRGNTEQNAAIMQQLQMLGIDPGDIVKIQRGFETVAGSTTEQARKGLLTDNTTWNKLEKLAQHVQGKKPLEGQNNRERVQKFLNRKDNNDKQSEFTAQLGESGDMLEQIYEIESGSNEALKSIADGQSAEDQERKGKEIAVTTRPMAEIFANAFEYLFNLISTPLVAIETMLENSKIFGGDRLSQDNKDVQRVYKEFQQGESVARSMDKAASQQQDLSDSISRIKKQLEGPLSGKERDDLMAQLRLRQGIGNNMGNLLGPLEKYRQQESSPAPGIRGQGVLDSIDNLTDNLGKVQNLADKVLGKDKSSQAQIREQQGTNAAASKAAGQTTATGLPNPGTASKGGNTFVTKTVNVSTPSVSQTVPNPRTNQAVDETTALPADSKTSTH